MSLLVCEICGADRAKSGKFFDVTGLAKHMTLVHPGSLGSGSPPPPGLLSCKICGCTQSLRGKPFLTDAKLQQHMLKCHPDTLPQSGAASANNHDEHPVPSPVAGRKRRNGAPTASPTARNRHVKFCPHCGFNLQIVHAAMEFINGKTN